MMVVDTHALLWWAFDPEKLSSKATKAFASMERKGGYASAISIWEIGIKAKRGKLVLPISVDELAQRVQQSKIVELVPVDTRTWLTSLALPWEHSDPADRVIVATALLRELPLLTKDSSIQTCNSVRCIW